MSRVINFIEENADSDSFTFYFNEKEGEVDKIVSCSQYKDRGQKIGGTELGDLYEIIVISWKKKEVERFQAILISPAVYINRMLNDGFWGTVGRATTSSQKIFDKLESDIMENIKTMKGDENV